MRRVCLLILCLALWVAGCGVKRTMTLRSDPPGALVYLNGEEVARTPAEVPMEWYGNYDVAVRHEGYETLKTTRWVAAPWWGIPPLDLVAELLPLRLHDHRVLEFELQPAAEVEPGLLDRAEEMREETANRR